MIIVSDTSPISALIRLDLLEILPQLFGSIIIPPAVERELLFLEKQGFDLSNFRSLSWIQVQSPSKNDFLKQLLVELDEGEAEAIALAKELSARFLLIDELKGRSVAESCQIPIVGLLGLLLLGLLLLAKKSGIIQEIRPVIIRLRSIGFYASTKILNHVLNSAKEESL